LNLEKCAELTDETLKNIGKSINLHSLQLDGCKKITNNGLEAVGKGCSHVISLGLNYIPSINDESSNYIAKYYKNLKYLHIIKSAITQDGIDSIKTHCTNLQYITSPKSVPLWKEDPKFSDGEEWLDEQSVTLWMRASDALANYNEGEEISDWRDYSKANVKFIYKDDPNKAKVVTKPTAGRIVESGRSTPAVQFLSTSVLKNFVTEPLAINDYTIFLVKRNTTPTIPNQMFFSWQAVGTGKNIGMMDIYQDMDNNFKYICQASGKWTADYICVKSQIMTTRLHLLTVGRENINMKMWQHNNPLILKPGSAGPLKGTGPYELIWGDQGGFGVDLTKKTNPNEIVEFIMMNRALNDEEIHEVWTLLQQKYQFDPPLPVY